MPFFIRESRFNILQMRQCLGLTLLTTIFGVWLNVSVCVQISQFFVRILGLFNKLEFIGTGRSRSRGHSTCSFVQIAVVAGAKTTRKQQRLYFLFG